MVKFGIEIEQRWEEIFNKITSDVELRKILDDIYSRADRGAVSSNQKKEKLSFFIKASLINETASQFMLSKELSTIIYNLKEYDIQSGGSAIKETIGKLAVDKNSCMLDVGCGAGQTLMACLSCHPKKMVGTDIDPIALKLGAYKMSKSDLGNTEVSFVQGKGDSLNFDDNFFTQLICRVVLHKLDINKSLDEFQRVTKKGALVYLLLPSFGYYLWRIFKDTFNVKHFMLIIFILINGSFFSIFNRQIKIGHSGKIFQEICIAPFKIKQELKKRGFNVLETNKKRIWFLTTVYEIVAIKI